MRLVSVAWLAPLALAILGLLAAGAVGWGPGWLLAAGGAAVLAARALRSPALRRPAPLALGAIAVGMCAWAAFDASHRLVAGILAMQALVAALGMDARRDAQSANRLILPLVGHATVLVAAWIVLRSQGALPASAAIALASGATILALHAYWTRRLDPVAPQEHGWEALLLGGVLLGLFASLLVHLDGSARFGGAGASAGPVAAFGGLLALAAVARPPPAPPWLRIQRNVVLDVAAHGVAGTALLNVFFLAYSLVATWSVRALLAIILVWTFVGVQMEYRNLLHFRKALARGDVQPRDEPLPDPPYPVTVIVPAANEAEVLPESLALNLAIPYPLRFVLVPAVKSKDATVEIAHALARENPDRVSVVEGTTGSKAEDLNLAWRHVDTDVALILDADETLDAPSLATGLRALRENPDAGIVQGRKVSRAPEESALARFVSTERRYSTGMDTVMHAQQFGSTHFGGSAALFRREVPPMLGGWTTLSMTEDIDFTLRTHLDGRWRIHYEPRMLVRESDPRNLSELLKQRVRWSRGWIQCVQAYLPSVVARRRELGTRRALGLSWMLLTCVAALWTTLFPATVLLRLAGLSLLMPIKIALLVALLMLPARVLSYGYGALKDPVLPVPRSPKRYAEFLLHAYLWILFGWVVSIHSLYQEMFSAPRVWYVTGKKGGGGAPPAAARGRPARG